MLDILLFLPRLLLFIVRNTIDFIRGTYQLSVPLILDYIFGIYFVDKEEKTIILLYCCSLECILGVYARSMNIDPDDDFVLTAVLKGNIVFEIAFLSTSIYYEEYIILVYSNYISRIFAIFYWSFLHKTTRNVSNTQCIIIALLKLLEEAIVRCIFKREDYFWLYFVEHYVHDIIGIGFLKFLYWKNYIIIKEKKNLEFENYFKEKLKM